MKLRWMPFLLASAVLLLQSCVFYSTDKNEVGVRTRKLAIFGEQGVEDKVYAPGSTYFFLPLINDWHTFDTNLQNLEMTLEEGKGDRPARDDLLFKTIDGNDISLDVIIAYQIDPAKAPYILQYVAPNNRALREKIIRTIARSKPRDVFGELKSEEFYVANQRETQAQKVREVMQQILGPMGIVVKNVLTKDYRFNEEYQKAIEDRKIADQQAEKFKSAQRAAMEENKRKLAQARGEVNKIVARADGQYRQATIEADAYYQKQQLVAEAIRTEGSTQAQGIREMNQAMALRGGETLVKLQIAEAMQGKRILLLPVAGGMNLQTTDMNQLIQALGVRSLAPTPQPPAKEGQPKTTAPDRSETGP